MGYSAQLVTFTAGRIAFNKAAIMRHAHTEGRFAFLATYEIENDGDEADRITDPLMSTPSQPTTPRA